MCFAQTGSGNETTDDASATLYIYRPGKYTGALAGFDIHVTYADGTEEVVGRIKNNNKFEVKLKKEGQVEIWAKTEKKAMVKADIVFGKSYYVKAGMKTGVVLNRPELTLVDPSQGKTDYEEMRK